MALLILLSLLMQVPSASMDIRVSGSINADERQEIETILNEEGNPFLAQFQLSGNFRLDIYVCKDAAEFIKITGAGVWNGGHFMNRAIYLQRFGALVERGILRQTVLHEFLHYCIWRKVGQNCPSWLNEGIVLNLTGELRQLDCMDIPAITDIEAVDRKEIDKLLRSKNRGAAQKGYCMAGLLVGKLLQKTGVCELIFRFSSSREKDLF